MFCASGPWKFCHLQYDLPQVVLDFKNQPADGEKEEEKGQVGGSVGPAESGVGDFLQHSIDQNLPK